MIPVFADGGNKIAQLMRQILQVRYTDIELERDLCRQLLDLVDTERDIYAGAFANVYLFDSMLAMGDYTHCSAYLMRAYLSCRENGYEELLCTLCNCAGLYYLKLNAEQTALNYYLEGIRAARKVNDYASLSKLYNNIGMGFAGRGDWPTAKAYFDRALDEVDAHGGEAGEGNIISYLSNLSETNQHLGDVEGSAGALIRCERIGVKGQYQQLRLACGWCAYYYMLRDRERCITWVERVLEIGLLEYGSNFFVCDMCINLCEHMMDLGEQERAKFFLDELLRRGADTALIIRYRIQCLAIRYWEEHGTARQQLEAYRECYNLAREMARMDDEARAQSMLSKIQIDKVQREREAMLKETSHLENVSQQDELTGLYNRRYFGKLVSKIARTTALRTLGYVIVDMDYLGEYNDHYGHLEGDNALKAIARILLHNASKDIYASRYGGDEFLCLCVNQTDQQMEDFVKGIQQTLARQKIPHERSRCGAYLTASIGYSNEPASPAVTPTQLLHLADQALYQAKTAGRNGWARKRLEA